MSKVGPSPLPEDQVKLAVRFSNPVTYFQHGLLSPPARELMLQAPVLFWLLVNHSSLRNWREKKFVNIVTLKRTEILGIVCGFPGKLSKSALKFLSKFDDCKLNTDTAAEMLIEWVSEGRYKRLAHYKVLSLESLYLFNAYPTLIGAKLAHFMHSGNEGIQGCLIIIRDMLKMADALGKSSLLVRELSKLSTIEDVRNHHDEILKAYLEQTGVESTLEFPDPPLAGNQHIIPITNSDQLFHEGIDQDNCVYSYLTEILSGQYFVYRVKGIERATLGVSTGPDGTVDLDQLLARSNSRVSRRTFEIVDHWINPIRDG
jgi:hypothetical protein